MATGLEALVNIIKTDQAKALADKGYQVTPEIEAKIEQRVRATIEGIVAKHD